LTLVSSQPIERLRAQLFKKSPLEEAKEAGEQDDRPEHYVVEAPNQPTIIIATGPDRLWRPPVDELRAIAQERIQEYGQSERALSWGDRQRLMHQAWIDQMERRQAAAHGKLRQFFTGLK